MLLRHAAARRVPRQARRWRVRHVVRQGSRRRSRRRCAALRQFHRHLGAWRRAGGGRRRPWRALVDLSASDRARLPERVHSRAESGLGPGHRRPRSRRHCVVALLRSLGRDEDHRRDDRTGGHAGRSHRLAIRHAGFPHPAAWAELRSEPALPRRPRRTRTPRGRRSDFPPCSPGHAPTGSTAASSVPTMRRSASITVGKAHEDTMHALRMLGLEGHSQIALYKIGDDLAAGDRGSARVRPRQARSCWWSRKSAASSNRRSATRCTICPPTSGRRSAARPPIAAAPLLSPLMELSPEIVAAGLAGFLAFDGPERRRSAGVARCRNARPDCCTAFPRSAPAVRTRTSTQPARRAASPAPASAATSWRWTTATRPAPSPTWAARARRSSACRRSPTPQHMFANIGDGTYHAFRHHGDPPGGRREGAHHLQAPVQRRGGDDRRPAGRGRLPR